MPDDKNKVTDRTQLSAPQDVVDTIWKNFTSQKPGFIRSLLRPSGDASSEAAPLKETHDGSYNAARRACIDEVTSIVGECSRRNQMFTDPDFDILDDFENGRRDRDCLFSLPSPSCSGDRNFSPPPKSIRRVHDIFDKPSFAPQAPKKHLPSPDHDSTTARWRPSTQNCVRSSDTAKLWLQATFVALSISRFFDLISLSTFFRASTLCGLLLAGCIVTRVVGNRLQGPDFASCHVAQGYIGDCWWMSAIAALCSRGDLMRKICVAWDQDCGVYGFLFYRDGAWFHTVVDDRLYLEEEDFYCSEKGRLSGNRFSESAKLHEAVLQKGPDDLYFAQCGQSSYTWLPLLQKASAKVHGDYEALVCGQMSEGLVDITGGVGENLETDDTKDQDRLWRELSRMDKEHIYALSTPSKGKEERKVGLALCHAYAIEDACSFLRLDGWKLKRVRLLKIRNPWGFKGGLWQGDWGVGSSKWSPISIWWLQFRGNEDGVFYMAFEHALKTFETIARTSVFNESMWTSQQHWVSMNVSWEPQFNSVYFELHLTEDSKTAFSVSQLDTRYFAPLQGRYIFHLEFGIKSKDTQGTRFIAMSRAPKLNDKIPDRSASITTELKKGIYEVLVKVTAVERDHTEGAKWSAEDVFKQSKRRPLKLQRTARNYDQAYGKLKTIEPKTVSSEQSKKSEQPEKAEKADMSDEPQQPEKPEQPEKSKNSESSDNPEKSTKSDKQDKPEEPEKSDKSDKSEKPSEKDVDNDKFVYPDPGLVAWNAVCGIGLRVFSKDPAMRLEVHHRDEGKVSETKEPAKEESNTKKDEEKTNETWKVTIEGVARWEKEKASDASQQAGSEDRVEEEESTKQGDDKDDK